MAFDKFWSVFYEFSGKDPIRKDLWEKLWDERKSDLRKLLGGNYYEEKVALESSDKIVQDLAAQFASQFPEHIAKILFQFFSIVTADELRFGRLNSNMLGFSQGTKLGKVLIKYLKENGVSENLDAINSAFSNLLQKIRADEIFVRISIDPLDFLLASENTTGWKSCHSLDGCHRAGNLAYLLDSVTVIAYAYKTKSEFCGLELPRKIWRQFVYVDIKNAVAYFQRQYPSEIPEIANAVRNIIEKLLAKYHNVEKPKWLLMRNPQGCVEKGSSLLYLDGTLVRIRMEGISPEHPPTIFVGERVPCPNCGERYIQDSESFFCRDCEPYENLRCCNCGRIVPEDLAYYYDNEPYCEDCWNDLFTYCWHCDATIPRNDAYAGPDGYYYCWDCYRELFGECDFCGAVLEKSELIETPFGDICCPDCFYERFCECSWCGKIMEKDDSIMIGDEPYCGDCVRNPEAFGFSVCALCGCTIPNVELIAIDDNCKACAQCAKKIRTGKNIKERS